MVVNVLRGSRPTPRGFVGSSLWTSFIVLCLAATAGAGCATRAREITPLAVNVSHVPDLGLKPDESIDAFDFVMDDSGSMHFVWSATRFDSVKSGIQRTEIWYRRGDSGGTHWTRPLRLGPGQGLGPRVVIAGRELHVLSGYSLMHWVSVDRGAAWSELAPMLGGPAEWAIGFDICPLEDNSLLITFIARGAASEGQPGDNRIALCVRRWCEGEMSAPHVLAQVAGASDFASAPKIACHRGRVHVFAGFNVALTRKETVGGRSREIVTQRGRLLYVTSVADSVMEKWGPARELPLPAHREWSVGDLAVLPTEGRVALFFSAYSVYLTMVDAGGACSPNVRLTPDEEPFVGSYASSSVSVARAGRRTRMVWIDARHQKSDRSLLNPLGGIPWSDSPDWCNNDVFTTGLPVHLDSLTTAGLLEPQRVTQPLSQARSVIIRAVGGRFCIAWNGRKKVGHGPASAGEPPELFFTYLP